MKNTGDVFFWHKIIVIILNVTLRNNGQINQILDMLEMAVPLQNRKHLLVSSH